jgi:hypothetical protein|tara:strand:- start:305 stop:565 length:261 start_codon:yes stop_codon:yes gene_type:complete
MTIDIGRLFTVTYYGSRFNKPNVSNTLEDKKNINNLPVTDVKSNCSILFNNLRECLDKAHPNYSDRDCFIMASMFDKCISNDEINL